MGKYLVIASYTPEGAEGILKDGGSARRKAVKTLAASVGGKLESFYFAFGEADAYTIAELPDATTAAAVSLAVNANVKLHEPKKAVEWFEKAWALRQDDFMRIAQTLHREHAVKALNPQKDKSKDKKSS